MALLPASQNKRRALYRLGVIGAMVLLALIALANRAFDFPDHMPIHAATTALAVVAVALSGLMFVELDEAAKQGHYAAWYWGGLLAISVVAGVIIVLRTPGVSFAPVEALLVRWFSAADAETAFLAGLFTAPALMLIGFSAWWAYYWLRRR